MDEAIKEDIHAIFAGVQLGAEDDDGAAHSQMAAPPGVDANAEVFEITDFTTASPWERFVGHGPVWRGGGWGLYRVLFAARAHCPK